MPSCGIAATTPAAQAVRPSCLPTVLFGFFADATTNRSLPRRRQQRLPASSRRRQRARQSSREIGNSGWSSTSRLNNLPGGINLRRAIYFGNSNLRQQQYTGGSDVLFFVVTSNSVSPSGTVSELGARGRPTTPTTSRHAVLQLQWLPYLPAWKHNQLTLQFQLIPFVTEVYHSHRGNDSNVIAVHAADLHESTGGNLLRSLLLTTNPSISNDHHLLPLQHPRTPMQYHHHYAHHLNPSLMMPPWPLLPRLHRDIKNQWH